MESYKFKILKLLATFFSALPFDGTAVFNVFVVNDEVLSVVIISCNSNSKNKNCMCSQIAYSFAKYSYQNLKKINFTPSLL